MQDDGQERRTERRYKIRQVTDYQASWVERQRGENGLFMLQLILDKGVEEHVLDVSADDVDVILKLLARSKHTMFDLERKVLMFENFEAVRG
jgi:hypothetical protein